jgi:hypothetical protein
MSCKFFLFQHTSTNTQNNTIPRVFIRVFRKLSRENTRENTLDTVKRGTEQLVQKMNILFANRRERNFESKNLPL